MAITTATKSGENASPGSALRAREPVYEELRGARLAFGGFVGGRINACVRNWLLTAPASNPAMLEMFHDREGDPARDLLPWSGEFAGKYLTSAVECYLLTRTPALFRQIRAFVADLICTQTASGYMGPFSKSRRMSGEGLWDLWGQYHTMLGLLRWHQATGDHAAMAACLRTADLFCRVFLNGEQRVLDAGSEEMNESCIHIFTLLYQETGEQRYLRLAREIEHDIATPPSGDYVSASLAGTPFYQLPKPRWEGLHAVQGIAELYFITGNEKYRAALEQVWWSILEHDRHNTGGFSAGEQAQGNPYHYGAIETCCTIAWMALTVDMLRMTGDARAADELELSTFNATLGSQDPNGRWWTYNTPMDGERRAGTQDVAFQARPGSPELNCCSVNAPRGLGMLAHWAAMRANDGIVLNYYGPSEFKVAAPSGTAVSICQTTDYPLDGRVTIVVTPEQEENFSLYLRVPGWSRDTLGELNGSRLERPEPGSYMVMSRSWRAGDELHLSFDMSPWLWVGERECEGKVSVYLGPILTAYDPRYNSLAPYCVTGLDLSKLPERVTGWKREPRPFLLARFAGKDGRPVTLCDFASAGMCGGSYFSWLPGEGLGPKAFTRASPLRAVRPGAVGRDEKFVHFSENK